MMKEGPILALSFLLVLFFTLFSSACAVRSTPWVSDPRSSRETAFREPKFVVVEERTERAGHKSMPDRPLPAENDPAAKGTRHKLEPGETLYALSRLYRVPVDRLMRANRISDPARVRAGTLIFIPGHFTPASPRATALGALSWPLRGPITGRFGSRGKRSRHDGIDIDGEYGDTVAAAAGGTVIQAWRRGGYGIIVVIDHGYGLTTLYAHLSTLLVRAGDRIERGDPIAKVGRSGNASGTHLHFEVHRNGQPVDPIAYLQTGTAVRASPPRVVDRQSPEESVIVERERHDKVVVIEHDRPEPAYPDIPPGHLPPPGKCRIWLPGRSPGHQPPPGDCDVLELRVPAGAYLIYGG